MEKLVAFLLLIVLIAFGVFFFNQNKMGGGTFTTFTLGLIIFFIGFYSIDRLKEFNVTGMKLVLSEMKDTKSKFDDSVAMLLEILGELNIDYTSNQGMLIGSPIPEELLEARAISVKMFTLAGKSNHEISLQTIKIDRTILWLYANQIITDFLKKLPKENDNTNIEKILSDKVQEIWKLNTIDYDFIDSFVEVLKSTKVDSIFYNDYIADMRFFIKENKLRRPFLPTY